MALPASIRRLFAVRPPVVSLEIAADRVTGLALRRGRPAVVAAAVTEPLPPGALVPTASGSNILGRAEIGEAVTRVLKRLPGASARVALVLPDSAAKVSMLTFEEVPSRAADLDRLVRWQACKSTPFKSEETQVAYCPGCGTSDEGHEFVVSLIRRDIVREYEAVCAEAGAHAGIVDLASFSQVNAILAHGAAAGADWLLVHVAHAYSTLALVRDGHLILFRNRPADGGGTLADLVHQTMMFYEDRLHGSGLQRVFFAASAASAANGTGGEAALLRRSIEARLGCAVEPIDLARYTKAGEHEVRPDLMAAPLGLLLRERLASETQA